MKKIFNVVIAVLIVLSCIFSLGIYAFAESENIENSITEVNPVSTFPSEFLIESTTDMESMIQSLTDAEMSKKHLSLEDIEEYTWDASVYVVKYDVADGFWNSVRTFDYNGITEALFNAKPEVIVPVFADMTDNNDNAVNRQISSVVLEYDYSEDKYCTQMVTGSITYYPSNVSNSCYFMNYEKIALYLSENQIVAENVFIINYDSFLSLGSAAVVKTETDAFILDITNSAEPKNVQYADMTARPYSISEYANLRAAKEERAAELNKQHNIEGLLMYKEIFDEKLGWTKYIGHAIAGAIVVASLAVFAIIKLRKRSHK